MVKSFFAWVAIVVAIPWHEIVQKTKSIKMRLVMIDDHVSQGVNAISW